MTLTPGDGAVGDDRLKTLANLRQLIPPAEASLDTLKLSAATLARQKKIVAASLAFLGDVAGWRQFTRSSLLAFTRDMAPLVTQNVTEATRAQLDATHAQVSAWRRDLSPREWSQLHVLIIGPHMPREDLVVTQYFLRLLQEPREGRRVVYAESLWEEPKALDLLGTHLLDGNVGEAFFGDYMSMHRDLLGAAQASISPACCSGSSTNWRVRLFSRHQLANSRDPPRCYELIVYWLCTLNDADQQILPGRTRALPWSEMDKYSSGTADGSAPPVVAAAAAGGRRRAHHGRGAGRHRWRDEGGGRGGEGSLRVGGRAPGAPRAHGGCGGPLVRERASVNQAAQVCSDAW